MSNDSGSIVSSLLDPVQQAENAAAAVAAEAKAVHDFFLSPGVAIVSGVTFGVLAILAFRAVTAHQDEAHALLKRAGGMLLL